MGVKAARLQPAHILRQPQYAVAFGAGEIGFGHKFGAARRVGVGQAGRDKRILEQRSDRARGHAHHAGIGH